MTTQCSLFPLDSVESPCFFTQYRVSLLHELSTQGEDMSEKSYVVKQRDVVSEDGTVTSEIVVHKEMFTGKAFFRVRLKDFVKAVGEFLTDKQFSVIEYMLLNVRVADNVFLGTIDEISKAIPVSNKTVIEALKGMQKANLIIRVRPGVYQFNPEILVYGDFNKEARLVIEYKSLKSKNKREPKPHQTIGDVVNEFDKEQASIGEIDIVDKNL